MSHNAQAQDTFNNGGVKFHHRFNGGNCAGHTTTQTFTNYTDSIGGQTVAGLNVCTKGFYGPTGTIERVAAQSTSLQGTYAVASGNQFVGLFFTIGPLLFGAHLLANDFARMSQTPWRQKNGVIVTYSMADVEAAAREYAELKRPRAYLDLKRRG